MEPAAKRRLGDIFVERCLITPGQLETALQAQRESGGKLGETLVELGFVSRVDLAGVLSEQWADLRVSAARNSPVAEARHTAPGVPTAVEQALRDRLDALTAELAARDQRIAQQDATISALLGQHPTAAQPSAAA
jgi:MSHA biogenesis protein MshE